MKTISQTVRVTGRDLTIPIPDEFMGEREFEITITPIKKDIEEDETVQFLRKLLADDTLSQREREAYTTALEMILNPDMPRVYGIFEGLFEIPDEFWDPLPQDILDGFEGKYTDAYGLSLDEDIS